MTFIVQLYEEQHSASALDYVAAAVEHFGSTNGGNGGDLGSFTELLAHVTRCNNFICYDTKDSPENVLF